MPSIHSGSGSSAWTGPAWEPSLGLAHSLADVVEFLRRAGLEVSEYEAARSPLIQWRGGGPYVWVDPPP
ncbi:hypothetical protein [Streptomyces lavendofoliae]|uniref:Uncharacterized protein n=1 Tax=Streptomyces lavendofoliae TaxID=67314 RepID=A0A918I674_9ACTN|nr:hypothetical protein [Streptomyces lavendofoliae]GGU68605.1 hypothetical protein GCM10010274_66130 [Streptomyces lavendofoliae]